MPLNVCNIEQLQLDTFSFISRFSNDSLARRAIINMKTSMNMFRLNLKKNVEVP